MPHTILKLVSVAVLALMIAAIVYAAWISLTHWHGIGV